MSLSKDVRSELPPMDVVKSCGGRHHQRGLRASAKYHETAGQIAREAGSCVKPTKPPKSLTGVGVPPQRNSFRGTSASPEGIASAGAALPAMTVESSSSATTSRKKSRKP